MASLFSPSHSRSRLLASLHNLKQSLLTTTHHNTHTLFTSPLSEISGSLGDIGTLLPLLIALTSKSCISLPATLVFSGLANILTGLYYGIPLPVQPMKAIAAVAIAQNFSQSEMMSAGLFVAGAIGFLSISGAIRWFTDVVPVPVVKGIQVGTGLSLILSAGKLYPKSSHNAQWIVLLLSFLALLISQKSPRRFPYALILFFIGIITTIIHPPSQNTTAQPPFTIWRPHTTVPSPTDFRIGTFAAGIGQLPLTTLNSIIAVSALSSELLPTLPPPSTTSLGLSVSIINLIGCFFGAMPVCHGSGGLAAQYRFGARSGSSVIILGVVKLLFGLFASNIALHVFNGFPSTLLCILLIAAGLELVKVGENINTQGGARDLKDGVSKGLANGEALGEDEQTESELSEEQRTRRWSTMFMTVAGILAFRNDAVGFLAGMLCHWSFQLQDWWEAGIGRRDGEGRIRLGGEDDGRNEA